MKKIKLGLSTTISLVSILSANAASTVVDGSLTFKFNSDYLALYNGYHQAPGDGFRYLDYFDGSYAHLEVAHIASGRHSPAQYPGQEVHILPDMSWESISFAFTPSTLPTGTRSTVRATDMSYSYDAITDTWSTSGQIGLEGLLRWKDNTDSVYALGDYFLTHSDGQWSLTQTVWANTVEFLFDVQETTETTNGIILSGDLYSSPMPSLMFMGVTPNLGSSYGTFELILSNTLIPEPGSISLLLTTVLTGLLRRQRR